MEKTSIKFDPARPHSEIWGQPGLAYSQDGQSFNGKGELVTDFSKLQPVDAPEPQPTPDDGSIPRCVTIEEDPKSTEQKEISGLEAMHWKTLQKMCGLYGIDYVNREQAISALKGKK